MNEAAVVPGSRLRKFDCPCGLEHRVMVRTCGDAFRCYSCNTRTEFPDERRQLAEASRVRYRATLDRFRNRAPAPRNDDAASLREELAQAKARAEAAEARLADLADRKRRMERQWVDQTLALYQEFETTLRPRVNKAESALDGARTELEEAWEKHDRVERQHQESLRLLSRHSKALASQLKLLKALKPMLQACADSPQVFTERGIKVDSLFCRAAILKALELLDE